MTCNGIPETPVSQAIQKNVNIEYEIPSLFPAPGGLAHPPGKTVRICLSTPSKMGSYTIRVTNTKVPLTRASKGK